MERFRPDNTEGFSAAQLAAMNREFERMMRLYGADVEIDYLSWQEQVAEQIAAYVIGVPVHDRIEGKD